MTKGDGTTMSVREEMEKSVLRKDLAPTRHGRARAHQFKYNLPEREGAKYHNPPTSLILAQKMPGSCT